MGAFLGLGKTGIWAPNLERDALLDWFAEHRCLPGDARWEWCKDGGQRYSGRCIDLNELLQAEEAFHVTETEAEAASFIYGVNVGLLLGIVEQVYRGEWLHKVDSSESVRWRADQT
jgi:hypothetical protein